jgi:hypothetical protein
MLRENVPAQALDMKFDSRFYISQCLFIGIDPTVAPRAAIGCKASTGAACRQTRISRHWQQRAGNGASDWVKPVRATVSDSPPDRKLA